MEQIKAMKEQLTSLVQGQLTDIRNVDAKELGEAVDMIKDLSETMYYCSIVKAMEESKEKEPKYYTPYMPEKYPYEYYRDMDGMDGKMYYTPSRSNNGRMYYSEGWNITPVRPHDYREGRSYMSRKNYMESKELHHDKAKQMKELETYMQELSKDITEMIEGSTPEEKIMLQQKLSMLIEKIK